MAHAAENIVSSRARAQAQRANMREVQVALGAIQPPLGPGAPSLRSEVAAENPTQAPGPLELGNDIQVREVSGNEQGTSNSTEPGTGRSTETTTRVRRHLSGRNNGATRSNRPRTSGRTIQDEMDERRSQLDSLVDSIGTMSRSLITPNERPNQMVQDTVGTLQQLHQNLSSIAALLGESHVQETNQRMYHAFHGLLGQHALMNQYNIPDAPSLTRNNIAPTQEEDDLSGISD